MRASFISSTLFVIGLLASPLSVSSASAGNFLTDAIMGQRNSASYQQNQLWREAQHLGYGNVNDYVDEANMARNAQQAAFVEGRRVGWGNRRTNNSGEAWPVGQLYRDYSGRTCAVIEEVTFLNGMRYNNRGELCQAR